MPTLSRILGSVAPTIRASTRFAGVGVLTPAHDGLLRYEVVVELTHGSVFVRPEHVPDFLKPPLDGPRQGFPAESAVAPNSPVRRFPTIFGLQNFCALPLDVEGGGVVFGVTKEQAPATGAEIEALRRYAELIAEQAGSDEPLDEKERSLPCPYKPPNPSPFVGQPLDAHAKPGMRHAAIAA